MAKKRAEKTNLIPVFPKIALLLIQFILIQIGAIPLLIIKLLISIILPIKKSLSKFSLSKFPLLGIPYTLYPIPHRHRGRPRKSWFVSFYFQRLKKFIKSKVPQRVKVAVALGLILVAIYAYTTFILAAAYQLPSPERLVSSQQPLTTEFYDRNGKLLYRLYDGQNRTLVKLEELPQYLIQATIAIEDKNFYKHNGVDFGAIARAIYNNYTQRSDHHLEGASTITQQLVKNSLLTPEKTYTRKIKEIILALWAETIYPKDKILLMYFNQAPYGGPNVGIAAASRIYFDKEPKDLTLAESAFLAGLPASPTQFSPFGTNPELGKVRQQQVLRQMVENKYISQQQAEQAGLEKLTFRDQVEEIQAPHLVFYVRDLLAQKYGPRLVSQGGLKITTTLDLDLQQEVEKIVKNEIEILAPLNVKNGAVMVTDAKSGQILSMVGSRDYHYPDFGNFNASLSLRQPGSSIKVITYSTAFKKGYSPGNTILDSPVTFRDSWGNSYSPQNYDGKYHGPVSIRQALGSSLNIPAVKMLSIVGIDSVIQTGRDLGITTFDDPSRFGLSLTLGGADVKLIDMMGVYGTFSQMGVLRKPTALLKVTDSAGNILEEYKDSGKQVLEPQIAYLITHILSDNNARILAFGSSSLLNLGSNVAVKTGTSDNKRDNWTFGYSTDFVVGVWVGNPDNSPMNPSLTSGITGAAPIWNKIMKGLLAQHPSIGFQRPPSIIEAKIDGRADLAITGNIPKGLVRAKTEGEKTIFSDAFSTFATSSAQALIKDGVTN